VAVYNYKASDQTGKIRGGTLVAERLEDALELIAEANLVPVDLKLAEKRQEGVLSQLKTRYLKVPTMDLIVFTKQLVTMVKVGIPMTQALGILKDQTTQARLRRVAGMVERDVEGGSSLSSAMGKHPKVFSRLYCSMVAAGESSGMLPEVMDRLIYLVEHESKIKAEVKSALRYPAFVVASIVLAFIVMISFVVPRFVTFFGEQGLDLPLPTRICIHLSEVLASHGALFGSLAVGAGLMLHFLLNRTDSGRLFRDRGLLSMPIVGPVLVKAAMTRFASIFAILQSSGVMVLDSFRILKETIGNAAIASEFDKIRSLLEEGHGISGPLRSARYFSPMLVNMVKVGEESGRLEELLRDVSKHYDVEIAYSLKRMTDSIGPIMIVALTGVIGFFALAIYTPMWELTEMATQR